MIKISLLGKEHLIPPRPHLTRRADSFIMYFITEGELFLDNNGEVLHLVAGEICVFAEGDYQKPVRVSDCKYYYVHFDMEIDVLDISVAGFSNTVEQKNSAFAQPRRDALERYNHMSVFLPSIIHIAEVTTFEYFCNIFKKNVHSFLYNSIEKRMELSYDMLRLFLRLEKICALSYSQKGIGTKASYATVEKIVDYIDKNFLHDIGSQQIEELFLMNFDYANRIFKQIVGKSIIKYRNDLRIECAKHLLLTTSKSVEDIAYESGFKDKFYFSRFFTKCVGVSPKTFREGD